MGKSSQDVANGLQVKSTRHPGTCMDEEGGSLGRAGDFKRRGTDGDPADFARWNGGAQGSQGVVCSRTVAFAGLIGCHLDMLSARL